MQLYIKGLYFNRAPLLWIKKDTEKPFNHSNREHFSERTKEQNSLVPYLANKKLLLVLKLSHTLFELGDIRMNIINILFSSNLEHILNIFYVKRSTSFKHFAFFSLVFMKKTLPQAPIYYSIIVFTYLFDNLLQYINH